ncbi:MAG: type II toxin-antitoxin system VapC family toxin, partial [Thermoleophilaceae bacterium]
MNATARTFAYLDASAFVKLVVREPESDALVGALEDWPRRVSSSLLVVEAVRAAARVSRDALRRAELLLAGVTLLPPDLDLLRSAARLAPVALRSLDSIHLATAVSLGAELGPFFVYDERLRAAAADASIDVQ